MKIAPWIEIERKPRRGANERLVGVRVTLSWWELGAWWRALCKKPPRPGDPHAL